MSDESTKTTEEQPQGVASPYVPEVPPPTFDYDKYQDDTTIKACAEILACIGKHAEILINKHDAKNEDIINNLGIVAQEIMNIVIDCKVPDADMGKMSDSLNNLIFQIFSIISRQKVEFEKELLARSIGIRDPGNNKYSREYAGLGDMFTALYKIRAEQGNNIEDYYNVVPNQEEE